MLRGEAHPLLYVAVHSDKMERMDKDRNGTVQASDLDSVQYVARLEVKTTKLGKTQNVLATFIVLWLTQQPSHISPYRITTIVRSVRISNQ